LGLVFAVLTASFAFHAAAAVQEKTPKANPSAEAKALTTQLAGADVKARAEAMSRMAQVLNDDPRAGVAALRQQWGPALLKYREFNTLHELSIRAILLSASETSAVETFQELRTKAFLSEGKNDEALVAAKQLYNVVSMERTAQAIALVAEALAAARPAEKGIVQRFRLEQLADYAPRYEAGQAPGCLDAFPSPQPKLGATLAAVLVGKTPYEQPPATENLDRFLALTGQGNLLLLQDKPRDALQAFERAYRAASKQQLVQATENVARAIRAEDGSIARANAWLLALRPPEAAPVGPTVPAAGAAPPRKGQPVKPPKAPDDF
jgi:hypothetical protein